MSARTPYSETEALLLALEAGEVDSGNTDELDAYLLANFLPGELRRLASGCHLLASCARDAADVLRRSTAAAGGEGGE